MSSGPPYAPTTAATGGVPTVDVDVPICAVFIVLFILGAIGNMTLLQLNLRQGHKFILSGLMFGFCMARIVTNIMRIVWATRPHNVRVAIAANIFTNAGVLLLYIVNLLFAQRMLRAAHPTVGWHRALRLLFTAAYIVIILALAMVITAIVQSFYTLNMRTRNIDHGVQLGAITYLVVLAALPLIIVPLVWAVPSKAPLDDFGKSGLRPFKFSNSWRTKTLVLLLGTALIATDAGFRTGVAWSPARPQNDPAWYHAKWCYYFFNFVLEILTIYLYLLFRVDQRFYVPDGSSKVRNYAGAATTDEEKIVEEDVEERVQDGPKDRSTNF